MNGIRGVPDLDLAAGDYLITPSETMRDVSGTLSDALSGDLMDDGVVHLYDVESADGERVLEVVDDRRDLKSFSESDSLSDFTRSGMRYSFRSPSGEYRLRIDRGGFLASTYAVREEAGGGPEATGDLLATLEGSAIPLADWTLVGPDESTVATVGLDGKLRQLFGHPTYAVSAPDGTEIGRFDVGRLGGSLVGMSLHEMAVTLADSAVPPEVGLAVASVLLKLATQSSSTGSGGGA